MNDFIEKIEAELKNISLSMIVLGVISACVFFLLFLESAISYRTSVFMLINTKSVIASEQKRAIIQNISEFPTLLSFYEKLLKENPQISDPSKGKSQDARKKYWNKYVEVKSMDNKNQNIIEISVLGNERNESELLAEKTIQTELNFVSYYYNIKEDVEIRIVDGPITSTVIDGWYWLLIFSILLGILVAFVLQKISDMFGEKIFSDKKNFSFSENMKFLGNNATEKKEVGLNSLEDLYLPEEKNEIKNEISIHTQLEKAYDAIKIAQQDPTFPEISAKHISKASAPDNLPVGDDSFFYKKSALETKEEHKVEKEDTQVASVINREPTQEELKKRLNDLLRGGI